MDDKQITILLIEDDAGDAQRIEGMLAEKGDTQFTLESVDRLVTGLARLVANDIGLVLLDLSLPDSRGFATFAKTYAQAPLVPIIVLSGVADEKLALQTVKEGAQDYLVKRDLNSYSLLRSIRYAIERKRSEQELQRSYHQLRDTMIAMVNTLASTVETRDPYTAGHQRRVTILACAMAEEMELTEEQFDGLRMAGLIHDIGKFSVPIEILNKPGRISETEFNIIKHHPQAGYNILKEIEFPWPVAQIVLQHHERLDGSGYPRGLKEDEIMLEAKILAVADVVEAMASHRPYRPDLGIEAALEEIAKHQGILYDPEVVGVCTRLFTVKGFTFE